MPPSRCQVVDRKTRIPFGKASLKRKWCTHSAPEFLVYPVLRGTTITRRRTDPAASFSAKAELPPIKTGRKVLHDGYALCYQVGRLTGKRLSQVISAFSVLGVGHKVRVVGIVRDPVDRCTRSRIPNMLPDVFEHFVGVVENLKHHKNSYLR